MPIDGLPEEVREFIRLYVSSIEQLEILLYLHGIAPREESGESIARALYLSPESTARQLTHFREKGLVAMSGSTPPLFKIDAKDSLAGQRIQSLAQSYRERRVSVINEIFSNPISTIQSFADAFIINKKKQ
jgi:hypothetical protein